MSITEKLIKQFAKENVMYSGVDAGNKSTKVSVLDKEGDIKNFQFSTVIAHTNKEYDALAEQQSALDDPTERIHVKITSEALSKHPQIYYVGEYAKSKDNKDEPKADDASKANKPLYIVTTLTGLAFAAWMTGREGEVIAPFSGGLPINEIEDELATQYLNKFKGNHTVEALDGPYKGKKIVLNIQEGMINVEGVTSELGISYVIEKGEIKSLPIARKVANTFAVVDAGAGTLDIGLFDENGFNAGDSKAHIIGTNPYIDSLMDNIVRELFKEQYELSVGKGITTRPWKTREQFMKKVIFPGVQSMLDNQKDRKYQPTFQANWGTKKADSEQLTKMVLETMTTYANEVLEAVQVFELDTSVESFIFLGGGLLFGYYEFRNNTNNAYIYPDVLEKAASLTSNAYLIRSFGKRLKAEAKAAEIAQV